MAQRRTPFPLKWLLLALISTLLAAACGGTEESTPTAASDPATSAPAASANAPAEAAPAVASLPDAPAPVDGDYRSDPATRVAATGNPQLLEFFTTW